MIIRLKPTHCPPHGQPIDSSGRNLRLIPASVTQPDGHQLFLLLPLIRPKWKNPGPFPPKLAEQIRRIDDRHLQLLSGKVGPAVDRMMSFVLFPRKQAATCRQPTGPLATGRKSH
jgi:hypothetical protein